MMKIQWRSDGKLGSVLRRRKKGRLVFVSQSLGPNLIRNIIEKNLIYLRATSFFCSFFLLLELIRILALIDFISQTTINDISIENKERNYFNF